ncbi:hypothetical protein NDM58_000045 [Vibrio parahaemolyticus]|nr:hypothetical protein [Vibrio parahaemolyticus]
MHCKDVAQALECCRMFSLNFAYYKAGWNEDKSPRWTQPEQLFFQLSNFNNYEQSVLNWCHIFGSKSDNLHWKRTLPEESHGDFQEIIETVFGSNAQWKIHWHNMKVLRDKVIAHVDRVDKYYVPSLEASFEILREYHRILLAANSGCLLPAHVTIEPQVIFDVQYSRGVELFESSIGPDGLIPN